MLNRKSCSGWYYWTGWAGQRSALREPTAVVVTVPILATNEKEIVPVVAAYISHQSERAFLCLSTVVDNHDL